MLSDLSGKISGARPLLWLLPCLLLLAGCPAFQGKFDAEHQPLLKRPGSFAITAVTAGNGQATVSWNAAKDADAYSVVYGTTSGSYTAVASANAASPFTITGLTNGTTYYVRVIARSGGSDATTLSANELPAFSAATVTPTALDTIRLTWPSIAGATTYTLSYGTSSGSYPTVVAGVTSPYSVAGLSQGQTYYFRISAQTPEATVTGFEAAGTVPSFLLDFTTASLDASVTYTRKGYATRVTSAGQIAPIAWDTPRFDYDPSTLAIRGLLVEEQRQNFARRSEAADASAWALIGTTVTADTATAPDGTTTADLVQVDTANSAHRATVPSVTKTTTNITYTYSVFLKAAGITSVKLWMRGATNNDRAETVCSLSSGAASGLTTGGSGWTALAEGMEAYGNGWYRCYLTATSDTHTLISVNNYILDSGGNLTFTGNGTDGVYIWGAQIEEGASMTSYIPTRNVLGHTEKIDETVTSPVWALTRATVTADAAVAPDGTTTADLLLDTAVNGSHYNQQSVGSLSPSQAMAASVYAKADTSSKFRLQIVNHSNTADYVGADFDLTLETAVAANGGTGSGAAATITNVGGGWYRCSVAGTPSTDTTAPSSRIWLMLADAAGATTYVGTGTGLYLWGAQLELGTSVTTYGHSTTAPVRGADNATIAAPGAWYSSANGTILTEFRRATAPSTGSTRYTAAFTDGTANEVVAQLLETSGGSTRAITGGVQQTDSTVSFTPSGTKRIVSAYANNDLGTAAYNTAGVSSASATLPVPNQCSLGSSAGSGHLNGHLRLFQFTPARAPDASLKDMSR